MEGMNESKVIILFSGGKDSFLTSCELIEEGFYPTLVTFDNGFGLAGENARHGAERIVKRYGNSRVHYLGIRNVSGIWREFFLPYYNLKPSEILEKYGELTVSQLNCLTCRSAMYVWSIIYANQHDIKHIAEGARIDQGFVIELPIMIERFKKLLSDYSISLLLPTLNLNSGWKEKNQLLNRGFIPKTLEPQCLLGVPLPNEQAPAINIQEATAKYYDIEIYPRAKDIISTESKIWTESSGEL